MTRALCHANTADFDLHAGIVVGAGERDRLERLCRYTLRPPVAFLARLAALVPRPRINLVPYQSWRRARRSAA